jgi:hypothetical protein
VMRNNLSLLAVVGAALLVGTTANLTGQTSSSATKPVSPAPVSLVAKEYPDGTRQVVRWSDLGAGEIDRGETHGGPPKIVPFDAQRDGFVPIGQTNGTTGHVGLAPASDMSSSSQPLMRPKKLEPYEPDLLYARFQVGTTFLNDQSVQQVDGVSTTTNLTFDPGLRGMFEVGGNLMEYLALEGNIGASWNSCNQGTSAALYQIPAMIGLLGQYPIEVDGGPRLTPYFGIDGGVTALLYDSLSFVPQGQTTTYSGSPNYINPVWQIRTGVMVELQDKWQLVAGYSFMGTWGSIGTASNINLGFLGTSTLEIGFQAKF